MEAMLSISALVSVLGAIIYIFWPKNEGEKILKEINKKFSAQKQYDKKNKSDLYNRRIAVRELAKRLRNERKANANSVADADKPMP